jgi:hypothetical protein
VTVSVSAGNNDSFFLYFCLNNGMMDNLELSCRHTHTHVFMMVHVNHPVNILMQECL